jgi:hypothetical protein
MRKLARMAMVTVVGIALTGAAVYSALPERISPVQATRNGDAETAVKIVGDGGGRVTRTFKLPPAPGATPRLGLALRPATYLKRPTGTITVVVGERDRCTFRPSQYTDGGTITCPVTQTGADTLRISIRGAAGPLALIERQSVSGERLAGLWVQVPSRSVGGRIRFVLTALSTTRPWPFSWPLALFCFVFAVCASLWLGLVALSRSEDLDGAPTGGVEADGEIPALKL